MADIVWTSGAVAIDCKVCGWSGDGEFTAEITAWREVGLRAIRCVECGSIDLLDKPLDSSPTDASIDSYVENGVGIGSIASFLGLVDPRQVRTFLDVGCNYGFALDLARHLYGWDVTGVEPSAAGPRGARELELDIRHEYLDEDSIVGDDFDLILASEVIEHVANPLPFVRALRARLSSAGHVVVTTPAAEIVDPEFPEGEILVAVSPGYHAFIASERGLALLLEHAGFTSVRVTRKRGSLVAIAGVGATLPPADQAYPIPAEKLESYYRKRAESSNPRSALALGMAVRYLRSLVARGEFERTPAAVKLVARGLNARHHFDVHQPRRMYSKLRRRPDPPWILTPIAFALGMIELVHSAKPQRAVDYFDVAVRSAVLWRALAEVVDLDTADLEFQSAYHRVLALTRFDPARAERDVLHLSSALAVGAPGATGVLAARECRILVEIASRGQLLPGRELERRVSAVAPALASDGDVEERKAALDAMFSIGLAHAQRGDASAARAWLEDCLLRIAIHELGTHGLSLAAQCRDQLARLGAAVEERPGPPIHSMIDTYWCDAAGTFIDGWMHLESLAVEAVSVSVGDTTVFADKNERVDLLDHWPDHPVVVKGGFSAYVPGHPIGTAILTAHTAQGEFSLTVELPDHQLPLLDESEDRWADTSILLQHMAAAPEGPVLVIGLRSRSQETADALLASFGDRELVSLDIHAGFGVTVVGDAHRLSALFPRNHFAIVFSTDLLEHVTTPWLVAAECAQVLKMGGLAIHGAPWVWPTHAEPNDFYRYSPAGLERLFARSLGFEVVESRGIANARVLPSAAWRHLSTRMPTTNSPSHSWVVAKKIGDAADGVSWPYDLEEGEFVARQYPIEGLASERVQE